MAGRVISAVLKFKDQNFSSGLRRANREAGDFGRAVNVVQNKVENFSRSAVAGFKVIGAGAAALGTGAVAGLAASVAQSVLEMEDAFSKLQAQTGTSGADLAELKEAAKDTFTRGYGESLSEVSDAVARVKQNMHEIDGSEIADVTSHAMLLANTFESDVNEVTRGANNMMQAFGVSADKAFDLFTVGGQRGLNFSNEMFDNVAEYAPLFGEMGYSAEEYFGILERGSKAGVYNLDYVNDVMKEFQIRVKDGSKATDEAMKGMSKETQNVWKEFMKGNGTVSDVASTVVAELKTMDDQVAAGQLAVSLFGTKWEDLEADAMYAMLGTTDAMNDFEGAAKAAADAVENSFGNRVKSAFRDLTVSIASLSDSTQGKELLDSIATAAENAVPKITEIAGKAVEFANVIRDNWPQIRETIVGITTAVVAFKVGMTAMTIISTITGFITAYRAALAAGTVAQWAMNAAMLANPIGLVIAAVAGLTAGIVLLYRNSDKFREGWNNTWNSVKKVAASAVNGVVEEVNRLISVINKIPGVNIPLVPKVDWGAVESISTQAANVKGTKMTGYAVGSNRITHDQVAEIHKDEMIIPARRAAKVRAQGGTIDNIDKLIGGRGQAQNAPSATTTATTDNSKNAQFGDINIYAQGATPQEVVAYIVPQLKAVLKMV